MSHSLQSERPHQRSRKRSSAQNEAQRRWSARCIHPQPWPTSPSSFCRCPHQEETGLSLSGPSTASSVAAKGERREHDHESSHVTDRHALLSGAKPCSGHSAVKARACTQSVGGNTARITDGTQKYEEASRPGHIITHYTRRRHCSFGWPAQREWPLPFSLFKLDFLGNRHGVPHFSQPAASRCTRARRKRAEQHTADASRAAWSAVVMEPRMEDTFFESNLGPGIRRGDVSLVMFRGGKRWVLRVASRLGPEVSHYGGARRH